MNYLKSKTYCSHIEKALRHTLDIESLFGKSVLILGASGLIGSFLTDCLIYVNETRGAEISLYVVSRKIERLEKRFGEEKRPYLHFIEGDVCNLKTDQVFDIIIQGAGYGHPKAFREIPVEVLLANVIGTQRVMEIAKRNADCRVLYLSSGEVQEQVDHLSFRACYPIGKMAAETLCISYLEEYGVDVVIARPGHTFGANVTSEDNRATAQFLLAAAKGKTIEMYSEGSQKRTFTYVADCVSGLLTILTKGEKGAVYGVSAGESCTVRQFAQQCGISGNCKVEQYEPTKTENKEATPIENQIVDNGALKALGWNPSFSIKNGIRETIEIMSEMGGVY